MRPSQPSLSRSSTIQRRGTGTQNAFTTEEETRTEDQHWHELQNVRSLGEARIDFAPLAHHTTKAGKFKSLREWVALEVCLPSSRDVGRIAAHEVAAVSGSVSVSPRLCVETSQ